MDYCPVLNITPRQVAKNLYVPTKKAKAKSVFTNEELSRLWEADPSIYSRAILIMIYSGMRIGELFQLRPEQVHLDDRYLVGGEKTEAGRDRTIPIRQEIVPLLADFLDNKGGSNTTASFTARVGGYLDAIGMDHTSHEARHTFISFSIQSQIPLPTIQQIVGHASGSVTTSVYTHIPTRELIKAVDSISFVW